MSARKFSFLTVPLLVFGVACGDGDTRPQIEPPGDITYAAAYVVNGQDGSVSVVDLASQSVSRTLELEGVAWPHHLSMNGPKTRLALGVPGTDLSGGHGRGPGESESGGGKLVVLDAIKGVVLSTTALPAPNHNAAFSPNGAEIWTTQMQEQGVVLVLDATTLQTLASVPVGTMPAEVTFSADGTLAFVANGESNSVTVIGVSEKQVRTTVAVGVGPVGAWPGSNNKMYVDNEGSKTVSVIDVPSLVVEETIDLGFTPGFAAFNARHNELWVSDADAGAVVRFRRLENAWTNAGSIPTGHGAHAITFTEDGSTAYVTNQEAGNVSVVDVESGVKLRDIVVGAKPNGILLREL